MSDQKTQHNDEYHYPGEEYVVESQPVEPTVNDEAPDETPNAKLPVVTFSWPARMCRIGAATAGADSPAVATWYSSG